VVKSVSVGRSPPSEAFSQVHASVTVSVYWAGSSYDHAKERQITYRPGEHHRSKASRLVLRSQLQHAHKCILLQDEHLLHVSRFFEVLRRNAWRQTYGMSSVVP
jgi:hypothetical protein